VRLADESICIGKSDSHESYLNIESLLFAAKKTNAQAVHPGYGFLSEQALFAEAVLKAGLVWIGPHPKTIEQMGNKVEAKKIADHLKIPTLPWVLLNEPWDVKILENAAKKIGFPLLLKAASGGGGRGMRLVEKLSDLHEKADSALREAKKHGAMTAAICNVRGSTLSREAGVTLYTAAGPEIGVASTKAFTTQILVLMMLAQYGSICKKMPLDLDALGMKLYVKLPHLVQEVFSSEKNIEEIVKQIAKSKGYLFVARGRLYPIALEGALKMKEITYLHAEGFAAGELKHGPIALVDSSMTVIVLAPQDELYEKTFSNLQEIKARGGKILAIGNKNDQRLQKCSDYFLGYPFCSDWSDILVATVPLQFLAYYMAIHTGTNVDQPRNLAKSVTVD
jgi:fructoselysine-6-P-deglycase FrlB-like protein